LVVTGAVPGKKRDAVVHPPDQLAENLTLTDQDIWDYEGDLNRRVPIDILQMARDIKRFPQGVPVFYSVLERDDYSREQRIIFGHTPYFRMPYHKTIGDAVPDFLQEGPADLAEALFGTPRGSSEQSGTAWATRLTFEDCVAVPSESWQLAETAVPKVLSAPKPTTIQHYLEQHSRPASKAGSESLRHWDSPNARIRGYKLYWHRNTYHYPSGHRLSWQEAPGDKSANKVHIVLHQVVKPGTIFRGTVRFENLSSVELGALLFVLRLPLGCGIKLGIGKPLGLGSVRVQVEEVATIDLKQYYRQLFDDAMRWHRGEWLWSESEQQQKIVEFERYMLQNLNEQPQVTSLWDTRRLRALRALLTLPDAVAAIDQEAWNRATRYMEIACEDECLEGKPDRNTGKVNEFKNRPILPDAVQVWRKLTHSEP
jgi:CRISPR-associated protein (TIGR03986 family)